MIVAAGNGCAGTDDADGADMGPEEAEARGAIVTAVLEEVDAGMGFAGLAGGSHVQRASANMVPKPSNALRLIRVTPWIAMRPRLRQARRDLHPTMLWLLGQARWRAP